MTIHIPMPLPRLVAAGGPVSRALRVMAEADPEMARIRELRRAIAARIEADLALLDALTGDPDFEPSLAAPEAVVTNGFGYGDRCHHSDQTNWGGGGTDDREYNAGDDREEENEHGGDIQDEPHDPQADDIGRHTHRWDPRVAEGARVARRQVQAIRARKDRGTRR